MKALESLQIISKVISFSKKSSKVVKVIKAFIVGYDAFISELNKEVEK